MTNDLGEEPNEEEAILAILKTFYPKDKRPYLDCVAEFNELIKQPFKGKLKLDLDFENKQAEYFIIADTYVKLADLVSLYNHLSGKKEKNISIQLARKVKDEFLQSVDYFKEKYEWIYNPPIIGSNNKHTIGKQLRQEFQEHYGSYAEITYLLSNGNALKFDEINNMKLENYLSLGEYFLRKRAVEGIE